MARKPSPERRQAFLDAALRLFVQKGVQHTSTAAIAKEAGSAAGTLFLYFPTRQDLINELVLQIGRQQSEYIYSRLGPDLSPRDAFLAIWDGSVRWFMGNMAAFSYIRQVRDSGLIDAEVVRGSEQYLQYYFEAIQRGYAAGVIKPYPIELIGNILYHDIAAVMDLIKAQPDAGKQETYIELGFEIFWEGIRLKAES
jgi:AcrR family transcriptional regulator